MAQSFLAHARITSGLVSFILSVSSCLLTPCSLDHISHAYHPINKLFQHYFLDSVCGCRPSYRWFVAGFGYLIMQERCCRNLQLTLLCSFVVGEAIARIISHRPRLVTLQDSNVRHPTPLVPYHVRISCNLARRLPFKRDTVGNM